MLRDPDELIADAEEKDLVILPRHRTVDQGEMDITPMIDITFLLLIFFLVASRVQPADKADLPMARYGEAVSAKDAVVITVLRGDGDNDQVFEGDTTTPQNRFEAADLAKQEQDISDYVGQQIAAAKSKRHVLIKADRGARTREVARVARAACRANGSDDAPPLPLYVAVRESEE